MKILIIISYVGMALSLTTSFPLMVIPMRYSIMYLFQDSETINRQYESMSKRFTYYHYLVTLEIDVVSLLLSLYITNLSSIFQLIGGTTSVIVSYVVPGLFMVKLYKNKNNKIHRGYYIGGILMIIISSILGIISTYISIITFKQ